MVLLTTLVIWLAISSLVYRFGDHKFDQDSKKDWIEQIVICLLWPLWVTIIALASIVAFFILLIDIFDKHFL